ncbi:MAG: DUF4422 domain-containing protein [Lachnospiraceae bacterium]|nr:DUF4422 domain-containing protein [Lachnospiraceae bacterium]
MKLIIYGAQGYALGAYEAIKLLYPEYEMDFFMVTNLEGNSESLGGLPVRTIYEVSSKLGIDDKKKTKVLICTPVNVQDEIEKTLYSNGFENIDRLDSAKWASLMRGFHAEYGIFKNLSDMSAGDRMPQVFVYCARSHKDRALRENIKFADNIHYIQVGTDNTDIRIGEYFDNEGDNISHKNPNYSELTALYWIWKNKLFENKDGYYGLFQYRRILELGKEDFLRLCANDVDAVLPYPMPYEPSIHAHHERYLSQTDFEALRKAVETVSPDYLNDFDRILKGRYLYNYNIILAKNSVLRDYCSWLFHILERVESLSEPKGWERADRYLGYMAETLETIYFIRNKDKLNIAHTGCKMLM